MNFNYLKYPEKTLAYVKPFLIDQWDRNKNFPLLPNMVPANGKQKVWWICDRGHEWETHLYSRNSVECKFCNRERPRKTRLDWTITKTKIASEWHPTKNKSEIPNREIYRIDEKAWWICDKGHEWEALISNRIHKNIGCNQCSGFKPIIGENDLASLRPDLLQFWDWENNAKHPSEYKEFSNAYVNWICIEGHKTRDSINHKANGRKCKFCSNKTILKGYNDFYYKYPDLAKEWDYKKNNITPNEIFGGETKKRFWLCPLNHSYQMSPNKRTTSSQNCHYCSNQKTLVGYNDLATTRPDLAKKWHPTKNEKYTPHTIRKGMKVDVWWLCDKGHEWKRKMIHQNASLVDCPECSLIQSSAIEQLIFKKISPLLKNPVNGNKLPSPYLKAEKTSVDISGIYNNVLVVIEYDGSYWHQNKEDVDIRKTRGLIDSDIFVIRIRENKLDFLNYDDKKFVQLRHLYKSNINVLIAEIHKTLILHLE